VPLEVEAGTKIAALRDIRGCGIACGRGQTWLLTLAPTLTLTLILTMTLRERKRERKQLFAEAVIVGTIPLQRPASIPLQRPASTPLQRPASCRTYPHTCTHAAIYAHTHICTHAHTHRYSYTDVCTIDELRIPRCSNDE